MSRHVWRGFAAFQKVHKNGLVMRAGEAEEQARAKGGRKGAYPSPFAACRAHILMVERSGSAREVAPEARRLRLVGGVIYLCFVSGRYGRK